MKNNRKWWGNDEKMMKNRQPVKNSVRPSRIWVRIWRTGRCAGCSNVWRYEHKPSARCLLVCLMALSDFDGFELWCPGKDDVYALPSHPRLRQREGLHQLVRHSFDCISWSLSIENICICPFFGLKHSRTEGELTQVGPHARYYQGETRRCAPAAGSGLGRSRDDQCGRHCQVSTHAASTLLGLLLLALVITMHFWADCLWSQRSGALEAQRWKHRK